MSSLASQGSRRLRFIESPQVEGLGKTSYVKDLSKNLGLVVSEATSFLKDALGGNSLQGAFEKAKKELSHVTVDSKRTAWDMLVSFLDDFRRAEIEHRKNLEAKYKNKDTFMWSECEARFAYMDVDTTAVFRSVIRLYTTDIVYGYVNNCFRSGNAIECASYAKLLRKSHEAAPYFTGSQVFRGMRVPDLDNYQEGLVYRWPFFVSASASEQQARKFGPVIFTIKTPEIFHISDIRYHSVHPEEEEVLFHPYTRFEVLERTDHGILAEICTKGSAADMM